MRGVYQVIGDIGKYLVYKLVYEPVHKQAWNVQTKNSDSKCQSDLHDGGDDGSRTRVQTRISSEDYSLSNDRLRK